MPPANADEETNDAERAADALDGKALEYKDTPGGFGAVKDVDMSKNRVLGYYAAFVSLDADGERFAETAFDQSIEERGPNADKQRIVHLYQHRPSNLIGQPERLETDDHGLFFETPILPTRLGKDVLIMYQEEVLTEHSVGFIRRGEEELDDGTVLITKAELFEGSAVTWGANPNTPVTGIKSYDSPEAAINDLAERARSLRRCLKEPLANARAQQMEIGLRQIEAALKELRGRFADQQGLDLNDSAVPDDHELVVRVHAGSDVGLDHETPSSELEVDGQKEVGTEVADENDSDDADDSVRVEVPDLKFFALDEDELDSRQTTFFPSDA